MDCMAWQSAVGYCRTIRQLGRVRFGAWFQAVLPPAFPAHAEDGLFKVDGVRYVTTTVLLARAAFDHAAARPLTAGCRPVPRCGAG